MLRNTDTSARSSIQYITYRCAELSESIYTHKDGAQYVPPMGFRLELHHGGTPEDCRIANWMILTSEDGKQVYLVFRGSVTVMDWVVNVSTVPLKHPLHSNVEIHSGYFAEISREYEFIKDALVGLARTQSVAVESLAITGHSKGGALAQLFMDMLVCDTGFNDEIKNSFPSIVCIVFAAAMVFRFKDPKVLTELPCMPYIHNFILHGDPVPVLQLLLTSNKASVRSLINREAQRQSILGQAVVDSLGIHKVLESTAPYIAGYRPIGHLHVAMVTDFEDLSGVDYEHVPPDFNSWNTWPCVLTESLNVECHNIRYHHKLCQMAYQSYLESVAGEVSRFKLRGKGLFVRNETEDDVLVILSLVTPLHWARVPKRSTRYIWSGRVWFTVSAFLYDKSEEPTQGAVALMIGSIAVGAAVGAPLLAVGDMIGGAAGFAYSALVGASTSARGASQRYFMNGVCADGRTVVVKRALLRGHKTTYLEISLADTASLRNVPIAPSPP
jgi:hypothetical protein